MKSNQNPNRNVSSRSFLLPLSHFLVAKWSAERNEGRMWKRRRGKDRKIKKEEKGVRRMRGERKKGRKMEEKSQQNGIEACKREQWEPWGERESDEITMRGRDVPKKERTTARETWIPKKSKRLTRWSKAWGQKEGLSELRRTKERPVNWISRNKWKVSQSGLLWASFLAFPSWSAGASGWWWMVSSGRRSSLMARHDAVSVRIARGLFFLGLSTFFFFLFNAIVIIFGSFALFGGRRRRWRRRWRSWIRRLVINCSGLLRMISRQRARSVWGKP